MTNLATKITDTITDTAITAKVKAKFAVDDIVNALNISVTTEDNGVVTLSGEVTNQEVVDRAVSIAKNTDGVIRVVNELTIGY